MRDYRRKCLESGVDDYLTKPIPRDELYAAIEKNLGAEHEFSPGKNKRSRYFVGAILSIE